MTGNCKSVNNKINEMLLTVYNKDMVIFILTNTWIKDQTMDKLEQMGT